jgi:hypothetical protein
MTKLAAGLLFGVAVVSAHGQSIEGYWQDTERRILFSRDAPPGYVYGQWTALDQAQTYPTAKEIRKSAGGVEVVELLYDDEEVVKVARAAEKSIEFTRTNTWSKCAVRHSCNLEGSDRLLCALETSCPVAGAEQVVWRGEERYARRSNCERFEVRRAQGIPHRCR